jgi:hypothetical protein
MVAEAFPRAQMIIIDAWSLFYLAIACLAIYLAIKLVWLLLKALWFVARFIIGFTFGLGIYLWPYALMGGLLWASATNNKTMLMILLPIFIGLGILGWVLDIRKNWAGYCEKWAGYRATATRYLAIVWPPIK